MTEKRKKGPILCEPDSEEAKRIEDTHQFGAVEKAQAKRLKGDAPAKKTGGRKK